MLHSCYAYCVARCAHVQWPVRVRLGTGSAEQEFSVGAKEPARAHMAGSLVPRLSPLDFAGANIMHEELKERESWFLSWVCPRVLNGRFTSPLSRNIKFAGSISWCGNIILKILVTPENQTYHQTPSCQKKGGQMETSKHYHGARCLPVIRTPKMSPYPQGHAITTMATPLINVVGPWQHH